MESKHSALDKSIVIGLYKMSDVSDWLSRSKPASKPAVLEPSGNMGKRAATTASVCKTRTGYLRMAYADGKMRMEKCGWKKMRTTKKVRRKKREMRMTKKKNNKQTNKGKKSFFQVAVTWLDPSPTYRT